MKRLLLTSLILLILQGAGLPSNAQGEKPDCNPGAVLDMAHGYKTVGDKATDMKTLYKLAQAITDMDIACNGYKFSGKGDVVLSSFTLDTALYKITATTTGFFILNVRGMDGCESTNGGDTIMNVMPAEFGKEVKQVSQTTFDVQSPCRVILSTANTQGKSWTLVFEPIQ